MNFIKDQWYKGRDDNYYIKFSHEEMNRYLKIWGETISDGNYRENDYWNDEVFIKYAETHPVNIEEIRQYLPKDHPDLKKLIIDNFEIF